jgi:flagellar biogenesis protein FliO
MDTQLLTGVGTITGVIAFGIYLLYKFCKEHKSRCHSKIANIDIQPVSEKNKSDENNNSKPSSPV